MSLIEIGLDVLKTTINSKTKLLVAQLGDVVSKVIDSDNADWFQHVGFVSRPSKPEAGVRSCQTVVVKEARGDTVIASRDTRGADLAGQIADGETCLYAPGATGTAQARVLLKADGSVNIFTRDGNTSAGQGVIVRVGADDSISFQTTTCRFTMDSDGITMSAGKSGLKLLTDGTAKLIGNITSVRGTIVQVSGATVAEGGGTFIGPTILTAAAVGNGCAYGATPANLLSTSVFISS